MKTKQDFINLIRHLIGENRIEDTLNLIEKYVDDEALNALAMLRSRRKTNDHSFFILSLISREEYKVELSKINKSILELTNDFISEKMRFDAQDWKEFLGEFESISRDFLNPKLHINDESYKKKIVTIIEYILKRSVDKTFDALELCTFTIENVNSTLPHAYEYRALSNFLVTPIETMIESNAVEMIEDLDFAKKIGKSENYDKIAEFIGFRFKTSLTSLISRLKRELVEKDKINIFEKRQHILNCILAYNKIGFHIYPSIHLRKIVVEELCGHNGLAWLDFSTFNLCDGSFEVKNNHPNYPISILEQLSIEISAVKQIDPYYIPPVVKIGSLTSEPKFIVDKLKNYRQILGGILLILFYILTLIFLGNPFIALVICTLVLFSIYHFQDEIPCVWRLLSSINPL